MKFKVLESSVEQQILMYLKAKRVFVWKNKTTGTFNNKAGKYIKSPYQLNGVSDILGILPDGRFLAIEVKRPYVRGVQSAGKPTREQLRFINNINNFGGVAFVCDSIESLRENLKSHLS